MPDVPLDGMINVRAMGAKGDAKTDDSAAFLAAIERAHQSKANVYIPRGHYVLSRPLVLEEIGLAGPSVGAWPADGDDLPTLLATPATSPCVELRRGASLCGIAIKYPHRQIAPNDPAPAPGPCAVLVNGGGVYISRVKIANAWDGIVSDLKNKNVGRLNISDCFVISPAHVGIRVTETRDVPMLRNVEVWNWDAQDKNQYGLLHGVGFELGSNDLLRMADCFVFGMQVAYHIADRFEGVMLLKKNWCQMVGCSADYCGTGYLIEGPQQTIISAAWLTCHQAGIIMDDVGARTEISGSDFRSNGAPNIVVTNCECLCITGTSLTRTFPSSQAPSILINGGRAVINGCSIYTRWTAIKIGTGAKGIVLTGNLFATMHSPSVVCDGDKEVLTASGNRYETLEENENTGETPSPSRVHAMSALRPASKEHP